MVSDTKVIIKFLVIFSMFVECLRKRARGHVTLRSPGYGRILVNNEDIRYFHDIQSREQVCHFNASFMP